MYIHIGDKKIISDKRCIGVFNADTMGESDINSWITEKLDINIKSIIIDDDNRMIFSKISSFTIMKRTSFGDDCIWSKDND